jgi:dolichyl-phosphate-mannose-protein mannosyltransferase
MQNPTAATPEAGTPPSRFRWHAASQALQDVHLLWVLGAAVVLVFITRWPLMPPHLFSFDSVNFAFSLSDFDPRRNQPQPPGYPLFVLEARALKPLFPTPEHVFFFLQIVISGLAVGLLFLLARAMFSAPVAVIAGMLLLFHPVFWYSGLTSPLRPHLALGSVLVAYLCWRSLHGDRRSFLWASAALAIAGGFRPELSVILFPLWLWAGWECGRLRLLTKGGMLLLGLTWVWVANLALACGGFGPMFQAFGEYANSQTFQSAVFGASALGWRHMVGRVIVWTSLGALPWLWTIPFGWGERHRWPEWNRLLAFLTIWLLPGLAFYVTIHSADPDHFLAVIPIVCLLGGWCLYEADESLRHRWTSLIPRWKLTSWLLPVLALALFFLIPKYQFAGPGLGIWAAAVIALLLLTPLGFLGLRSVIVSLVLLVNMVFFLVPFPFPQGPAGGGFRGLASARDAFLGGIYETSFQRVRWTSDMMFFAALHLMAERPDAAHPRVMVWARDGEPSWRWLAYYFPTDPVYVLDEAGDPSAPVSQARVWKRNVPVARYNGAAPIELPVPKGSRLVWFVGGGSVAELRQTIPVHVETSSQTNITYVYSDLPPDQASFRWGSFEFVPQ